MKTWRDSTIAFFFSFLFFFFLVEARAALEDMKGLRHDHMLIPLFTMKTLVVHRICYKGHIFGGLGNMYIFSYFPSQRL